MSKKMWREFVFLAILKHFLMLKNEQEENIPIV